MTQVEHSDLKTIANEVFTFYSKLYSSSFLPSNTNSFFQTIKKNLPSIDSIFKEVCESEITVQELDAAVKKRLKKPGKSPGPDGLTTDFYKTFWEDLKCILLDALQECIRNNELLPTMK